MRGAALGLDRYRYRVRSFHRFLDDGGHGVRARVEEPARLGGTLFFMTQISRVLFWGTSGMFSTVIKALVPLVEISSARMSALAP